MNMLIATCLGTSTKPTQNINTLNRSLPNMLPTKQHQSNLAQDFRGWRLTPHNHSPQQKSNVFKTSLELYCTMRKWLIQHFLLHSAQSQHDKLMAHWQWWMHVTNSLTKLLLTQTQAFDTKLATWYFWYTQTPPTFPNLVVQAE
jgi:hypothetical protein